MRLEDITAEVRPRGRWEAVDLGFAMVRRHFPRLLLAWFLCIGPIWALFLWGSQWIGLPLAIIVIWWLKPIYERLPLFVLSRALFGPPPTIRETLRAWPKLMISHLGHALVAARLSGTRTLLLPVTMLEGLRGSDRKQRAAVLTRHSGGCAGSLTFVCALYEGVLAIGVAMLLAMFIPDEGSVDWRELFVETGMRRGLPPALMWIFVSCWLVSLTLVELFYTGAGFGLYLNARTHLEGWDVELAFRRLGRRLAAALAIVLTFLSIPNGSAEDLELTKEKAEVREEIDAVLKHEDFKIHKVQTWRVKSSVAPESGGLFSAFSGLGYVLFWAGVAVAVYFLARFIAKHVHSLRGLERLRSAEAIQPARTVAGLDVAPESLTDDIVAVARERWLAGETRTALSLLYRGALSRLVHTLGLAIKDSDTEGDCLRASAAITVPSSRDYFTELTRHWVTAAYADRSPQSAEMEFLLNSWPFGRAQASKSHA
jgi:hypothetical protein